MVDIAQSIVGNELVCTFAYVDILDKFTNRYDGQFEFYLGI